MGLKEIILKGKQPNQFKTIIDEFPFKNFKNKDQLPND